MLGMLMGGQQWVNTTAIHRMMKVSRVHRDDNNEFVDFFVS